MSRDSDIQEADFGQKSQSKKVNNQWNNHT